MYVSKSFRDFVLVHYCIVSGVSDLPCSVGGIPSGHLDNTPSPSIEYCRTPYSRSRLNTERVKTSNRSGGSIEVLYENTNQHPAIPLKPWKKGGSLEVSHVFLPVLFLVFPFLGTSVTSPLTLRNPDWPTRT